MVKTYIQKHPIASSAAKVILATAIAGGLLTTLAVAPGLAFLIKGVGRKHRERKERYRKLWERFNYLRKQQAFEFNGENKNGELVYKFTDKGKVMMKNFLLETLELKPPKRWDKKWRIVIFDVPEKLKARRKALQSKLKEMDFYPWQRSVWAHPFPCEQEIAFLKNFLELDRYVEIFAVSDIPSGKIIYHFKDLLKHCI